MKKIVVIMLITLAAVSCHKGNNFERNTYSLETSSRMAAELVDGTQAYFGHIKSDEETDLGQGVSFLDLRYLNMKGYSVRLCMYKVVLGYATLDVAIPSGGKQADLPSALATEMNGAAYVFGAVNGDVQAADKSAAGIVYHGGTAVKASFSDAKGGFFAVLNDGTAVIADQTRFNTLQSSLDNAIGTREQILNEGYENPEASSKEEARSFVAVSQDGMTVWLGVVDGGDFYYSNGISCGDLAAILKAAGAWNAALLGGGDATTLVRRDEQGDRLFAVVNTPSANGLEKESVNALAIIKTNLAI